MATSHKPIHTGLHPNSAKKKSLHVGRSITNSFELGHGQTCYLIMYQLRKPFKCFPQLQLNHTHKECNYLGTDHYSRKQIDDMLFFL